MMQKLHLHFSTERSVAFIPKGSIMLDCKPLKINKNWKRLQIYK
jgi:hypothetical protein